MQLAFARTRIGEHAFDYRSAKVMQMLCGSYEPECVAEMEDWLEGATAEHFKVMSAIIRDAGPRFVLAHEEFIGRALRKAGSIGRQTQKDLSSAVLVATLIVDDLAADGDLKREFGGRKDLGDRIAIGVFGGRKIAEGV